MGLELVVGRSLKGEEEEWQEWFARHQRAKGGREKVMVVTILGRQGAIY